MAIFFKNLINYQLIVYKIDVRIKSIWCSMSILAYLSVITEHTLFYDKEIERYILLLSHSLSVTLSPNKIEN